MTQKKLYFGILSFGNIIEWYDFSLYIYFSIDIANQFFPDHNFFVSYLLSLSTFFFGFLVRPLGALALGYLCDRYNHRWMINLAVVLMGASTFAVALLPTYQTIGIMAPILLMLLRVIQGLSAGGQFPGLISLSVQDFPRHRCMVVGFMFSISSLGFLFASLFAAIISHYFPGHQHNHAWRIGFLLSGIFFLIYLYLHRYLNKHVDLGTQIVKEKKSVFWRSILQQWKMVIAIICLTLMAASLYYLIFTYLVNYQIIHLKLGSAHSFLLNSIMLLLVCILYPLFGHLADRINHRFIFYLSITLLLLIIYPLMYWIQLANLASLFALALLVIAMAAIQGAISPLFATVFSQEWATIACAFSYSIGNALSGGAPLLAEMLTRYSTHGLSMLVIALLLIGLLGMLLISSHQSKAVMTKPYMVT